MMERVLITGFEPFGDSSVNPSEEIVGSLDGHIIGNSKVVGRVLKLEYETIRQQLTDLLSEVSPDAVVLLGQHSKAEIALERVGLNLAHTERLPYNCGSNPYEERLIDNAPDAYLTRANILELRNMLKEAAVPCHTSLSAGAFGCNQAYFHMLHLTVRSRIPVIFVHVPRLPQQTEENSKMLTMTLVEQIRATKLVIQNIKHVQRDEGKDGTKW